MLELVFKVLTILTSPETVKLADAVHQLSPKEIDADVAWTHTVAALVAETPDVPATLLLSIAYSESRYNPYSVSHVRDGKRQWGVFKTDEPPKGVSGPYFCGPTQIRAYHSWKRCTEFRDVDLAYQTSVKELKAWFNIEPCRSADDKLMCAMLGYGGGFPAIKANKRSYALMVIGRARSLARKIATNT